MREVSGAKRRGGLIDSLRRLDDRADAYAQRTTHRADGTLKPAFASPRSVGMLLYAVLAGAVAVVRGLAADEPLVAVWACWCFWARPQLRCASVGAGTGSGTYPRRSPYFLT